MLTAAYAIESTERGKCMNLVADREFIVSKRSKNTGNAQGQKKEEKYRRTAQLLTD